MRLERASILALVLFAAACNSKAKDAGHDDPIVARVGTHTVTKSYYQERLAKMDRKFVPDTLDLAGKRKFLDYIINKEVLALKAEDLGLAEDPEVKEGLKMIEENLLHSKSVELATAEASVVTEEEIQKFYELSKNDVMAKHVLLQTSPEAEDVLREIRAGASFDSMVDIHSTVPRIGTDGLELPLQQRAVFGWLQYGQANPAVEKVVFETPLNSVADPVETPYGWHVFMPVSTRDRKALPYADERDRIERQLQGRKRRDATNEYYESILTKRRFVMQTDAANVAYDKLPLDPDTPPDPGTEVKPVIDYTYQERQLKLFEVDGKEYTVGDFSDLYDNTPWPERPRKWVGAQGLYFWIRDIWLKPLQIEQARTDGVDKIPDVANDIKLRHEMLMVGKLHSSLIAQQVPDPTEEDLRAFYEKHADVYVEKEKRICNLIYHIREGVVRRAYEEIRSGADFMETAIRYNDNAVQAKDVQTTAFSIDDEPHRELAGKAYALGLHEYTEPFKTSQGWIVLQVQQIIPSRLFEMEDIYENVVQDWRNQWSDDRLNQLLEEWKKDYTISVDDKVLGTVDVERDDVFVPGAASPEGTH